MVKLFGRVVGLRGVDLRLFPGEVLAVIGDNGAGKSTLIKCLSGAMIPDRGTLKVDGKQVSFKSTPGGPGGRHRDGLPDPRGRAGPRHRQQPLPRPRDPAAGLRRVGAADAGHQGDARARRGAHQEPRHLARCRTSTSRSRRSPVGSARSSPWPAPARSAARWRSSTSRPPRSAYARPRRCSAWSATCATRASAVILISHNMPNVFETADRIHVQRLGGRAGVISPKTHSMQDAVAIMTGAMTCRGRRADPALSARRHRRSRNIVVGLPAHARGHDRARARPIPGPARRRPARRRQHGPQRRLLPPQLRHAQDLDAIEAELDDAGVDHEVLQPTDGRLGRRGDHRDRRPSSPPT